MALRQHEDQDGPSPAVHARRRPGGRTRAADGRRGDTGLGFHRPVRPHDSELFLVHAGVVGGVPAARQLLQHAVPEPRVRADPRLPRADLGVLLQEHHPEGPGAGAVLLRAVLEHVGLGRGRLHQPGIAAKAPVHHGLGVVGDGRGREAQRPAGRAGLLLPGRHHHGRGRTRLRVPRPRALLREPRRPPPDEGLDQGDPVADAPLPALQDAGHHEPGLRHGPQHGEHARPDRHPVLRVPRQPLGRQPVELQDGDHGHGDGHPQGCRSSPLSPGA